LVYRLEPFTVVADWSKYRTANHLYKIRISQNTKVNDVVPVPGNFHLYAYDAKPFDYVHCPRVEMACICILFDSGSMNLI
jgi:hypothetical protein